MTTFGEGRITFGRWWIYLDLSRQFIGRDIADESVVYAFWPLVFEHFRPEHHAQALADRDAARAEAARTRAIKHWQGVRNGLWMTAMYAVLAEPGESLDDVDQRRRQYVRDLYRAKAGEARARNRGWFVPTIDELRVHRPSRADQPGEEPVLAEPELAEPVSASARQPGRHRSDDVAVDRGPGRVPSGAAAPAGRRAALTLVTKD